MIKKTSRFLAITVLLLGLWQLNLFGQDEPEFATTEVLDGYAAAAYWTPENRAQAIPIDLLLADQNAPPEDFLPPTADEPQVSTPGELPVLYSGNSAFENSDTEIQGYPYPYPFTRFSVLPALYACGPNDLDPVYPYTTIGKLFFRFGQNRFVCSASVMRPHLLLTARHCIFNYVHPSGGQFAQDVAFFPDWFDGVNPCFATVCGTIPPSGWPARRLATWVANAPNFRFDIGFIQTFDDDCAGCNGSAGGFPIEAYTGFLGFTFGGNYSSRHWNEFGYPQAAPFNGNRMIEAQSSTGAEDQFGLTDTVEVGNDMTGGSSGGPWILNFFPDLAGAVNFANGLNSFKFTNPARPLAMNGPKFFQYNFGDLLNFAQGLSCP